MRNASANTPHIAKARYDYNPFGERIDILDNMDSLNFIGKEKDAESSLGDFGVRKYEDFSGRFTSIDPLLVEQYAWSPYHYSYNNPIRLSDKGGLLQGDPFKSSAQEAHDFGKNYINNEFSKDAKDYSKKTNKRFLLQHQKTLG